MAIFKSDIVIRPWHALSLLFAIGGIFLFLVYLSQTSRLSNTSASESIDFSFSPVYKNPKAVVARSNRYDSSPTIISDAKYNSIWYCGNELDGHRDVLVYTKLDLQGKTVTSPKVVLKPSSSTLAEDGYHACSPTVIKQSNPNILGGKELYRMYYECAAKHYARDCPLGDTYCANNPDSYFTQICHAVSEDGIHWQKWNKTLWDTQGKYGTDTSDPTPVITISDLVKQNCQYRIENGKHTVIAHSNPNDCSNRGSNYGSGHPTAIVRPLGTNGQGQIWLFYYDSAGAWDQRAVWVTTSWDGFHFDTPRKTTLQNVANIKFFPANTLSTQDVFIGVGNWWDENKFGYSYDAINWSYPTDANDTRFTMGHVTSFKPAGGHPGLAGDKNGFVKSKSVTLFSPERNTNDPLSWDIYLMRGDFTTLSSN